MFPRPRRGRLEAELHGEVLRRRAQARLGFLRGSLRDLMEGRIVENLDRASDLRVTSGATSLRLLLPFR
jgi:hypothetical protein